MIIKSVTQADAGLYENDDVVMRDWYDESVLTVRAGDGTLWFLMHDVPDSTDGVELKMSEAVTLAKDILELAKRQGYND